MKESPYLTKPLPSPNMPAGIPYIVGNEAAERFSFYGNNAILVTFMTGFLMRRGGMPDFMSKPEATARFHEFLTAAYFFSIIGALISDGLLGKYRTILSFSIVYCLGHLALAIDDTRLGLFVGLGLIALGAGGIKPCVSAHVGDQFGPTNQHLLPKVFAWFYFSINVGAAISQWLIPELLVAKSEHLQFLLPWKGPHLAFGVPGIVMLVATIVFWSGRHKFVHVPPGGLRFVREAFQGEGLRVIVRMLPIFLCLIVYYALYFQAGSAWVLQAKQMDLHWLGVEWLAPQVQIANGVLVLVFIPLFAYVVYPAISRFFPLTPLRKMGIGFFLMCATYVLPALIETWIAAGEKPSISWQLLAYVLLTASEVFVNVTCLEFAYTQAPREMKSVIMAIYLLSLSAGNLLTAIINEAIQRPDGSSRLEGADYFWTFGGLITATSVMFVFVAMFYRGKTYIQPEATPDESTSGTPA